MVDNLKIAGTPTTLSRGAALKILFALVVLGLVVAAISTFVGLFFDISATPLFRTVTDNPVQTLGLYLVITIIATILVPLPTLPLDVVLFQFFNLWLILLLRLIGDLIGSAIAYWLARRYGPRLINRWFSKKNVAEIIAISESVGWKQYFWIAMFPLVNTELVAYAAGLSKLKLFTIIWIIAVAVAYRLVIVALIAL